MTLRLSGTDGVSALKCDGGDWQYKIFKQKAVCEACAEDACLEGECCAEEAEAPVEEVTVEEAAE